MINYQELKDNLDTDKLIQLMYSMGAQEVRKTNFGFITNTICHNVSDGSLKLYYYENSHMFMCYTECGSLSIFKLIRQYYEQRDIDYDWFKDIVKVVESCSLSTINFGEQHKIKKQSYADKIAKLRFNPELPIINSDILNIYTKYYPIEWQRDHITKEAMDKFNIRFSTTENKVIIPHYNADGNLVGIRGRALNQEEIDLVGKYMPVQIENQWYSHPLGYNLYGLNVNKEIIKENGLCIISESEKSVLQMESFNMPNCAVAVCGSQINKVQINLIMKYCRPQEICVCFDREENEHESKYYEKLYKMCSKYRLYTKISFIYYGMSELLNMKDSPFDKGEEIFKKLLAQRSFI